ncbi:MAG: hypothetical protein NT076_01085 [Candidatus Pacearchaeota archaeon]|nr:hypothetical protein [Candidatus Pacearchaeota archaeon]
MELKKIKVWSFVKMTTLFGGILSLISVVVFAMLKGFIANLPAESLTAQLQAIANFTLVGAIYGIIQGIIAGFIYGILIALLYNLLAKMVGGIKLEFSK